MDNRITEFTEDVEVIQKLGDYPNTDDGMNADELKAKFDQAPSAIKRFLNKQVVPAVQRLQDTAGSIFDKSGCINSKRVYTAAVGFRDLYTGEDLVLVDSLLVHEGYIVCFYGPEDQAVTLDNIASPTGLLQAANKQYVDEMVASSRDSVLLRDSSTNKIYQLSVNDGKLTMTEVLQA